jgi:hypothetical protein
VGASKFSAIEVGGIAPAEIDAASDKKNISLSFEPDSCTAFLLNPPPIIKLLDVARLIWKQEEGR